MSAQARRGGSEQVRGLQVAADPGAIASILQLYSKAVSAITQLFARASDGTVTQLTVPKDYILVYRSGGNVGYTVGADVNFDTQGVQSGNLALSSRQVTGLQAGRTYRMCAGLHLTQAWGINSNLQVQFRNATAGALIGTPSSNGRSGANTFSDYFTCGNFYIFTPGVVTTVSLRQVAQAGGGNYTDGTFMIVEEL